MTASIPWPAQAGESGKPRSLGRNDGTGDEAQSQLVKSLRNDVNGSRRLDIAVLTTRLVNPASRPVASYETIKVHSRPLKRRYVPRLYQYSFLLSHICVC